MEKTKLTLLHAPKDRSVESYRKWILDMMEGVTGKRTDTTTAENWESSCKEFWDNLDSSNHDKSINPGS